MAEAQAVVSRQNVGARQSRTEEWGALGPTADRSAFGVCGSLTRMVLSLFCHFSLNVRAC